MVEVCRLISFLSSLFNRKSQFDINDGLITVAKKQVKTNEGLITACKGLADIQKNNMKIMTHIMKSHNDRAEREERNVLLSEIRYCDEQLEEYKDNPTLIKIIQERKEKFKSWLKEDEVKE